MAKATTKQKFELATLDAKNLKELDGWKEKQQSVVKENPFIEIVDRETYETAKSRRTALVSARTGLQKQDKLIGSFMANFRKQTKAITTDLIEITLPHETKQQSEVSRYEEILEEKRKEKELAENARVEKIQKEIQLVKELLEFQLQSMKFENIEETKKSFYEAIEKSNEFDYEEFEPMFDQMIAEKISDFDSTVEEVKLNHEQMLEQQRRNQESEMNSRSLACQKIIDETNDSNKEYLLENIKKIMFFNDYDFGDFTVYANSKYNNYLEKANNAIKAIEKETERRNEIQKQEDQNRIINVREGLLDKIFQMSVDNYIDDFNYITEALEQENPFPSLEPEFQKMIEHVQKNLDQKMELLNSQLNQRKREEEAEEKRMEVLMAKRTEVLKNLGLNLNEEETEFTGHGLKYDVSEIYEMDDLDLVVEEIRQWNEQIEEVAKRKEAREQQLVELGLVKEENLTEDRFHGFDLEVFELTVEGMSDGEWKDFVVDIENRIEKFNTTNEAFKKRQEKLKVDKEQMVQLIMEHNENLFTDYSWKNKETLDLWETIQSEYTTFMNSRIEKINKF